MSNRFPGPAVAVSASGQPLAQGPPGRDGLTGSQGPPGATGSAGAAGQPGGQTNITLANGLNSDISIATLNTLRAGGPSSAFSVGGFAPTPAASGGQPLGLVNTTTQVMTIVNEDPSSSGPNRITVGVGRSVTIPPSAATAFVYDATSLRWILQSPGLARPKHFNVNDFGAKGLGDIVLDGTYSTGSGQAGSESAHFLTKAAVGMRCTLTALGSSTVYYGTVATIVSDSAITVTWASATPPNLSGAILDFCFDDGPAIDACFAAAKTAFYSDTYAMAPEVHFPAGRYGRTTQMNWDASFDGMRITGASSRPTALARSVVVAMAPMACLVLQNQCGVTVSDMWLRGGRLTTQDTHQILAPTLGTSSAVRSYYDRCRWDAPGPTGACLHIAGLGEIDNSEINNYAVYADSYDLSYMPAVGILNDNPEAFQFELNGGCVLGCNYGILWASGATFFLNGPQVFDWGTAGIEVQTAGAHCVIRNLYNEGNTGYILRIDATAPINGLGSIILQDCILQQCPVYTCHSMQLIIDGGVFGADVYSDPEAARFTTAAGTVSYGTQLLVLKGDIDWAFGSGVVPVSGDGRLVHVEKVTAVGSGGITHADGIVSGTALSFAVSTPLAKLTTGAPVQIDNAGPGGNTTYYGFIKSVTDSQHATLLSPVATNIGSGATVRIGNTGVYNALNEYFQWQNVQRSPGKIVATASSLAAVTLPATWQASTAYVAGTSRVIPPTPNGLYYQCSAVTPSSDDKSGGSPPTFPTTIGATVADNHVTWMCWGPTPPTSYDANGLVLGVAAAPTDSGVIIAADRHEVSGLTAHRTYEVSQFGMQSGTEMPVWCQDSHGVTLNNNGVPMAILSQGQLALITNSPSSGLVLDPRSTCLQKTSTTISNVSPGANVETIIAVVTLTPFASRSVAVQATMGPGLTTWTTGTGILRIRYNTAGGGAGAPCGEVVLNAPALGSDAPSVCGFVSGLTAGTAYDFQLCFTPTGAGATTGASCGGGITAREVN